VLAAVDLFPTLCTTAGGKPPEGYLSDGEDLSSAILGETRLRARPLFWEYGRNDKSFAYPKDQRHRSPTLAVRESNWKLLVNSDGSGEQLFDLASDPNETNDLAAQQPEVVKRLRDMTLAWWRTLPENE
jgi:arylsulfatase A-like enzyme